MQAGLVRGTRGFVGWGDAFVDFANRGWDDLLIVNGHVYPQMNDPRVNARYLQPKLLFYNRGDGTFANISDSAGPALLIPQVSRGMAVGDLFNDGRQEAVIENLTGPPMILQPQTDASQHWISIALEGVKCNRLALNARVRVVAGDLVQLKEVHSGGSYLSQNDLRLHFGLGAHARIDRMEILWPDGSREVINSPAVDRIDQVRQGAGIVSSKTPQEMRGGVTTRAASHP
jgi:hypothetical protein